MDAIVKMLEKHQPLFEKISKNIYLQAIKDGFLGTMPIILFSSLFLLMATMPTLVDIVLPQPFTDWCNKLYAYTMGVVGIMVAGTTAKALTASMNRRMPAGKVLNDGSTMIASMCGMLILAVSQVTAVVKGAEISAFDTTSMGTRGLFSAYIAAFITVFVYKFCVTRDLTIPMPKEVPGAIAQNFRDIIPFGISVLICSVIDLICRAIVAVPFSELLIVLLSPLFQAAESYPGLIIIQAMTSFFWFIGIHGPSIVQPAIDPIRLANQEANLQVLLAGGHPEHSLCFNLSLVGEMGGTGATFIVPILFLLLMKSKQLKAVGKASIVPVCFAVNEPLLFAAPMILNPYVFIPFIVAPCVNVCLAKFFIDVIGMNGFSFVMPWATPAPIGIFASCGFQPISLLFVVLCLVVDAIIYLPFLKAYDRALCREEEARSAELAAEDEAGAAETTQIPGTTAAAGIAAAATADGGVKKAEAASGTADDTSVIESAAQETADASTTGAATAPDATGAPAVTGPSTSASAPTEQLKVLVLCAGAGTSRLLSNALIAGAEKTGTDLVANAGAYGSHYAILPEYNVVVLAPQVRTYYDDMKLDTDKLGITLLSPRGKEYIDLTNDPEGAVAWLLANVRK